MDSLPRFHGQQSHLRRLSNDFLLVSSNLRGLMCNFNRAFRLFELPVPTDQIVRLVLSHRIIRTSSSCIRMSALDCQIMHSAVRIFADLEEFLRSESGRFLAANNT